MKPSLKISQVGLLLVSVPLGFELIFAFVLVLMLHQAEEEIDRAERAKSIIEHANVVVVEVMKAMGSLQSTRRKVIDEEQKTSEDWKQESIEGRKKADNEFDNLVKLVADRPMQGVLLRRIQDKSHACYAIIERMTEYQDHDPNPQHRIYEYNAKIRLNDYFYQILQDMDEFSFKERKIEQESPARQTANRQNLQYVLIAGIAFNIMLAIGLALYFSRSIGRRLMVINRNSQNMAEGKPLLAPLLGRDEIANVDRVFHSMALRLRELDELKRDFVAMVSHDLRTPLTSLQAFLTLLEAGVLEKDISEKTKERARGAEEDVARLIRLINELLDLEKMERGTIELKIDSLSVKDLISRSVESVKAAAEQKKLSIVMPDIDRRIVADRDRLIQVIVNILSNAIKFSSAGSSIEISAKEQPDHIEIRITDHGRGIPDHLKDAIFDRFRQVELSDATEKGGTGLGLAICKSIIEQHGGKIGVESEFGKGSTFWIQLPKDVPLF